MTKTIGTKDGTHSWDDVQVGDYLVINGKRHLVERRYELFVSACEMSMTVDEWITLGAHLERDVEEHQHGVVPEEHMLHVVFGGGGHAVNVAPGCDMGWSLYDRCSGWYWASRSSVQSLADKHGFTRLVPEAEVEAARLEGRKQGIREASSVVAMYVLGGRYSDERTYADERISNEFPEAFTQDGGEQA